MELPYLTPEWDPHSTIFQEQEDALMDKKGSYMSGTTKERVLTDTSQCLTQCWPQL